MPGSGFRAPWRGRKARNSAPNPGVKDRQPRHRQAPIQSPAVEARVSVRERPCIGFFAFNTHDLPPPVYPIRTQLLYADFFRSDGNAITFPRFSLSHPFGFVLKRAGM